MITLIGLGAGDADSLSRGAERALRDEAAKHRDGSGVLFLRTARHPSAAILAEWDLQFETFDSLYDTAPDFAAVYGGIADRILEEALRTTVGGSPMPVAYAVPGHPLFGEEAVRRILERARAADIPVRIIASGSFVEAVLTALRVSLDEGCDVRDALSLRGHDSVDRNGAPNGAGPDVSRGLLLFQVFDTQSASNAKLALMRDYPDDWEIALVRWAGVPDREEVRRIPLFRLDREPVDHLTSVYVPPLPPPLRPARFPELVGIMARLRAPDGCPWDREQSHETLKRYFIEETYEVLEAIDAEDPDLLAEELGDALLQVVFHAQLASEEGIFTIDDVTARIVEKLVRRHPHVFGDVSVNGSEEVLRNWEQIKRAEKTVKDASWRASALDGVPKGLPALMQAMEISKRAVKVGFEWGSLPEVLAKLDEEVGELKAELAAPIPDPRAVSAEIGDLLFTVVQVARWQKLDAEDALRTMTARFSERFRYMEARAKDQGRAFSELSVDEMDAFWNEAKLHARNNR